MAIKKINLSGHENQALQELGYEFKGALHVRLEDPELPGKVTTFLKESFNLNSDDAVEITLPGLAPLAAIVLAAIHGLTGSFPKILSLVRQPDGSFVPAEQLTDLQQIRNETARARRENIIEI